jgi:hypothetical protein
MLICDALLLAHTTIPPILSCHMERGYESLIGFRICFNLDDAVMLDTVVSVLVGLSNRRLSGRLRVWVGSPVRMLTKGWRNYIRFQPFQASVVSDLLDHQLK